MTKNEREMRQRGKRLMKTLKKSVFASAAKSYDEEYPPYKPSAPEWYGNEDDDEEDDDGMD